MCYRHEYTRPWKPTVTNARLCAMDTVNPTPNDGDGAPNPEADAEKRRQLAWEAEMIAEARAELDAGLYVDAAEVDAWIDSIGTEHELPLPRTRRR